MGAVSEAADSVEGPAAGKAVAFGMAHNAPTIGQQKGIPAKEHFYFPQPSLLRHCIPSSMAQDLA